MLLVGLTGGLGAGKSTVAAMLADRGAIVVDADELARDAIAPGTPGEARVLEAFGSHIAGARSIDRDALAAEIFADEDKRRTLESIVHPEVFRLLAETVDRNRGTDAVVLFDAPLIFETGFDEACDVVVVVSAPVEEQVKRASRERGMGEDEARARIAAQIPAGEREDRADIVIRNDGDLDALSSRVDDLWRRLQERT